MDARSLYTPSAWQTEFHNLPHREALGAGAAGPGKTTCLQWEPLAQIVTEHQRCADKNHPHHIEWGSSTGWVLYLRRQMPMLEQQMNRAIQAYKRIDPNFEWRAGTNTGVFKSGLHIQFGHCNDISDFERYMSLEVTMVIFDELRQFERVQYENIVGRLRSTDPVLRNMLKARAMSNPTDRDGIKLKEPNWVRDYFVKDAPDGRVTLSRVVKLFDGTTETWDRIYLPAKLSDNPDKDFVRSFETNLRTRPIHIQRALLHGDWFSKPGSFFGEDWDSSVHICKPFQVPTNWRHFRSMDWGFKSHGVVLWWAQDPDGTWFIHRELSFIGMHPDKVAAKIIEIEESMGLARKGKSLITGPADTQLWEQRGDRGLSKAQEMAKMGVRWVKANKSPGSIARNSERLLMLLRDHKEDGVPGIVFFNTCRMCIQTIPEIMPDKDDPNVPDKNYPDDHWLDCLAKGTPVTTPRGVVPIEDVKPGECVRSTDGGFWPSLGAFKVRDKDRLMRVVFEDGSTLTATPDHVILCADGQWKRVDHLDATSYAFKPWTPSASLKPAKSSTGFGTTSAAGICAGRPSGSAAASLSIGRSTERLTAAFQRVTTSITSTVTRWTTASRTWWLCQLRSIEHTISLTLESAIGRWDIQDLPPQGQRLPSGTEAPRAGGGIASTHSPRCAQSQLTGSAFSAEQDLSTGPREGQASSAEPRARQSTAETQASTTWPELALPAGERSWRHGMKVPPLAHGAAVRVLRVEPVEDGETWCIQVPVMSAFEASGVIVSNCARYGTEYSERVGARSTTPDEKDEDIEDDTDDASSGSRGTYGYG